MKKALILLLSLSFLVGLLWAQEYKGKGRAFGVVTDEQGNPLEGVTVKLFYVKGGQGFNVKTDKDGKWIAAWIRGGQWNIDFEKIGYAPKKIAVELQEFQKNPEIKIALVKVEGLVVTDEIKEMLEKGNQLFDAQNYDEARVVYEEILTKYPDAYPIWKNVGNCYFAVEKYAEAEQAYQKILEKDPNNADAMVAIGNTFLNRGDKDKAFEWYGKVNVDKITDPVVIYNVGTMYYNNSRFSEALTYYQKAVEKQKNFTDALYQLGLTYLNLQKNQEAIQAFEEYLKIDSESPRADQVRAFLAYLKK
ncbi:MAG: tetratricopeptide repeat protein [Candidatus Saccharicenans sp.]|uniref:tetratricopeptide repeat protein n=1 Tax=Candidatus Saccharicenans sp. TaxID=2819258 RepID=UPI0040496C85